MTKPFDTNTPSGESKDSKCGQNLVQSPVLEAISAHLAQWYPNKLERLDLLEEIIEQPPVGMFPPYETEAA